MDRDLGSRNASQQDRQVEVYTRKTVKKSSANNSRHQSSSQQQPGRFLCVDTRKDQVYAPKVRPNSSYTHNFSSLSTRSKHFNKSASKNLQPKRNLKAVQNRTVQPDSHCKFKTTLAIEYVRDLLDENATNSRPIGRRNSLKKNGQLKPLLGAGRLNLEPNVTKCLGIQNDRQRKTVTLEDGLEVREELITPDMVRFSSASKRLSPNTLTVDLRKLSLVDQSETLASSDDDSSTYEEQRQEIDSEDEMKNPRNIIHKNSDLSQHDTPDRHWADFSSNHGIDDNDHSAVGSAGRYNQYNQNEPGYISDEYIHEIIDESSSENRDADDVNDKNNNCIRDDISDDVDDHIGGIHDVDDHIDGIRDVDDHIGGIRGDIWHDVCDDTLSYKATPNHQSDLGKKTLTFQDTDTIIADKNHQTVNNDDAKTESKSSPTLNEESNLKISEERLFNIPSNSTTPSSPRQDYGKTADEEESTREEYNPKRPNIDEPRHNSSAKPLPGHPTTPLLNQSTPDQDSVHVKDIWKALVDGGYDISRDEVSKYKVNSTKPRIKSAPARRRSSQGTNSFARDAPTRARSAVNRDGEVRARKECFAELNEVGDSHSTAKNPKFVAFVQKHASETKVKQGQKSLSSDQSSLEVVAVSKPVNKLLRKTNIPSIPPLNFQINTIPKSGHFFYFAYGLNMNQKRLEIQLRRKTGVRYWSLLFGFKLLFNKKGSAEGGVGFPNVVHEPGFSVEGCVYELSLDCLSLLDTCVGFPKHYSRLILPVWMCNSLNPDKHGVAQHCVPAVVYVAQDDWVASDPTTLDTSFTLKQCVLGTDLLTPNYQTFVESSHEDTASEEYPM